MGKWIMLAGLVLVLVGAAIQYAPWAVSWFGRLPGDIRWESGRTRVFLPVTSMILISIVVTVLLNFFRR